jgi:hypothetical protein
MIHRILTFNIGGPMRGWYCDLEADSETIIREFAREHWPHDWVTTYDPVEFQPQIEEFHLRLLCKGWIEAYEGRRYFHEGRPSRMDEDESNAAERMRNGGDGAFISQKGGE